MRVFHAFNGDADGICALTQRRLAASCAFTLITGVKRDISLARQVPVDAPAQVNMLAVRMDANRGDSRCCGSGRLVLRSLCSPLRW